jgi:hypothetical protein
VDAVARVAPHPRREVVASAIATTAIATATGTGTATATATATGIATATGADEGRCFGEGLVGGQRVGTGLADADAPRRQGGQEPLHGGAREELGEARHGHGHAPDVLRVRQHVLLRRGALQRVSARHGHAAAGAHAQEHRVDETHRRAAAPRRRFRFRFRVRFRVHFRFRFRFPVRHVFPPFLLSADPKLCDRRTPVLIK